MKIKREITIKLTCDDDETPNPAHVQIEIEYNPPITNVADSHSVQLTLSMLETAVGFAEKAMHVRDDGTQVPLGGTRKQKITEVKGNKDLN